MSSQAAAVLPYRSPGHRHLNPQSLHQVSTTRVAALSCRRLQHHRVYRVTTTHHMKVAKYLASLKVRHRVSHRVNFPVATYLPAIYPAIDEKE